MTTTLRPDRHSLPLDATVMTVGKLDELNSAEMASPELKAIPAPKDNKASTIKVVVPTMVLKSKPKSKSKKT